METSARDDGGSDSPSAVAKPSKKSKGVWPTREQIKAKEKSQSGGQRVRSKEWTKTFGTSVDWLWSDEAAVSKMKEWLAKPSNVKNRAWPNSQQIDAAAKPLADYLRGWMFRPVKDFASVGVITSGDPHLRVQDEEAKALRKKLATAEKALNDFLKKRVDWSPETETATLNENLKPLFDIDYSIRLALGLQVADSLRPGRRQKPTWEKDTIREYADKIAEILVDAGCKKPSRGTYKESVVCHFLAHALHARYPGQTTSVGNVADFLTL